MWYFAGLVVLIVIYWAVKVGMGPIPKVRAAPVPKRPTVPGPIIVHFALTERLNLHPEDKRRMLEAQAQWKLWAEIEELTR